MFNFGISAESAVRNTRRPLAPWNIYDVKFMGCSVKEFDGKKDPSQHYKVLSIDFENEEGYFSVRKFFPKDGDDERREYDTQNGGKRIAASNFEELMKVVSQTAQVLNPVGFEKMQAASVKFRSFEDVAAALIKITDPKKGTETKIKLIGKSKDGKVTADIPHLVGINQDTKETYTADNYIGDKLFFNPYEEGQREKYLNAKPTSMKSEDPIADTAGVDKPADNDFNLEDLL